MAKLLVPLLALIVGTFGVPVRDKKFHIDPSLNWRIVGGSKASEGQFPYQISMRVSDGEHLCGGSIIDSTTILTAAHCVHRDTPSTISVVVGSNTLNSGGTKYAVSSIRAHENYTKLFTPKNDIAILKLASPIEFSNTVAPIELETSDIGADVNAVLSGWGATSFPYSLPNDLQYILLKTISVSQCKSRHLLPRVRDSHVCTFTQKGEGICHGDSGGPLVANGKQIGVVSWGRPCGIGYPDVFTRVSSFKDWIQAHK